MTARPTFDRPRRCWEVRLISRAVSLLEKMGLSFGTLDEGSLLEKARRRTGLSDFGDDRFLEGLRVMLEAFEKDADANALGRLVAYDLVLSGLCNRLWIQNELAEQPEILGQAIPRPLIVVSLPRTGTTLLHGLLAQDPAGRSVSAWETNEPARRPREKGKRRDPRIRRAARLAWQLKRTSPLLPSVHAIDPRGPEECYMLLRNTFIWRVGLAMPTYRKWFVNLPADMREHAYREYRQQLQLLLWQRPSRGHLVLKSPEHLGSLVPLSKVLPDARIVYIHRDPQKVVPSLCSLFAVIHGTFSDNVRPKVAGPKVLQYCLEGIDYWDGFRREADEHQVLDLHYRELVRAPIETIRHVYDHFGYTYTDEFGTRAEQWLKRGRMNTRGKHSYSLEQFGLDPKDVDRQFEAYCRQYDVERES